VAFKFNYRPNLIEPVPLTIQQLDRGSTTYDEDAREQVSHLAYGAAITGLQAQVNWGVSDGTRREGGGQGGSVDRSRGYLVFRKWDLGRTTPPTILAKGDKLTLLDEETRVVYLYEQDKAGHHADSARLQVWRFEDRAPSRQM
jgi:hypothetical protein